MLVAARQLLTLLCAFCSLEPYVEGEEPRNFIALSAKMPDERQVSVKCLLFGDLILLYC